MNHVVIIGFMGSGKTRVGKQLSKDLGLSFVDLERLITRKMNMSAREIFLSRYFLPRRGGRIFLWSLPES